MTINEIYTHAKKANTCFMKGITSIEKYKNEYSISKSI